MAFWCSCFLWFRIPSSYPWCLEGLLSCPLDIWPSVPVASSASDGELNSGLVCSLRKLKDLAKLKETVAVFSFLLKKYLLAYLSIHFWLLWVFVAVCGLSLAALSGGYSLVGVHGLIAVVSLIAEPGSRVRAQQLWCMGLVALGHVGSSRIRDLTCAPCIGRWILNPWTSRQAPGILTVSLLGGVCVCVRTHVHVCMCVKA